MTPNNKTTHQGHDLFETELLDAAYVQARKSLLERGIPIGAAIGSEESGIVAVGHNQRVQTGDTTAHAEIVCIRNAGRRRDWHTLTIASTLSPCVMCTGALLLHRIPRVVIGEHKTFKGAEDLLRANRISFTIREDPRCIALMEQFILDRPDLWDEDIGVPPDDDAA